MILGAPFFPPRAINDPAAGGFSIAVGCRDLVPVETPFLFEATSIGAAAGAVLVAAARWATVGAAAFGAAAGLLVATGAVEVVLDATTGAGCAVAFAGAGAGAVELAATVTAAAGAGSVVDFTVVLEREPPNTRERQLRGAVEPAVEADFVLSVVGAAAATVFLGATESGLTGDDNDVFGAAIVFETVVAPRGAAFAGAAFSETGAALAGSAFISGVAVFESAFLAADSSSRIGGAC
jgi:hypothetical protein